MTVVSPLLNQYAELLQALDEKTREVSERIPELPCKNRCYECCEQLFPVSFIEAFYLSEGLKSKERSLRRERKRLAEKTHQKVRARDPFRFEKRGVDKRTALETHNEFAQFLHSFEMSCPALDPTRAEGACTVYEFRNHDCRTMGSSVDPAARTILGCERFNVLGHLAPRMMDYNFRYPDKMALDRAFLQEITRGAFTPNLIYYTTMGGPLLKDYSREDWIGFFKAKGVPAESDDYWVVIDV